MLCLNDWERERKRERKQKSEYLTTSVKNIDLTDKLLINITV